MTAIQKKEQGQSLVEFALCLPILLTIVLGILVFGIALNNNLTLTNATSISAQVLSTSRGQTTDPCSTTVQAFYSAAPYLTQKSLNFTIGVNGSNVGGTSCTNAVLGQGQTAQVTVTYPCNLKVLWYNFAPTCTLTATTAEAIQ